MTRLSFKTYGNLARDVRWAIKFLPNDIDLIVGVPRSGMIPAYIIAAFLNLPVSSLDEYLNDITPSSGDRPVVYKRNNFEKKKVLVVDDSVNSGSAMGKVKRRLEEKDKGDNYVFFAAYATNQGKKFVDYYAFSCEQPRIFQWNYLYHTILQNACFDVDGVLCIDPTPEQNDDGEKYIDFILNAKPLYIPNYKIKALVTSRLEKYRKETEEWLKKNNVQYEELYMLDLPNQKERIRQRAHGKFKSKIYSQLEGCYLFVESEREQAIEIANATNKPVICLPTDEMFPSSDVEIQTSPLFQSDGDIDCIKEKLKAIEKDLSALRKSKSFALGNLFFRSIRNPYKLIMLPLNFVRILVKSKDI